MTVAATIKALLNTASLPALGPQQRAEAMSAADLSQRLNSAFAGSAFPHEQQQLIRSLLLLWHDHLDASHTISQAIENRDGSFIHAVMHRREPDYWNAKYWWRRVGDHPAFVAIARQSSELLNAVKAKNLSKLLTSAGKWNADGFVDLCEQAVERPELIAPLQEVQRIETSVLLDHFLRNER